MPARRAAAVAMLLCVWLIGPDGPSPAWARAAASTTAIQPCAPLGSRLPVTLPPVGEQTGARAPIGISYGALTLTFASVAPHPDALCTLVSGAGALPIMLHVRDPFSGDLARVQIASSVATATLDYLPNRAAAAPRCDFSQPGAFLEALTFDARLLPATVHDCYLNAAGTAPGDVTARWHVPGFAEYVPDERGVRLFQTQPVSYYVDLTSLLGPGFAGSAGMLLNRLETYIHTTLLAHLVV